MMQMQMLYQNLPIIRTPLRPVYIQLFCSVSAEEADEGNRGLTELYFVWTVDRERGERGRGGGGREKERER